MKVPPLAAGPSQGFLQPQIQCRTLADGQYEVIKRSPVSFTLVIMALVATPTGFLLSIILSRCIASSVGLAFGL